MNYKQGLNRVFYQPKGFQDVVVEGYFYLPDLTKTETYTFTKLENGLYYLDIHFDCIGDYVGIFFEDSVKIKTHVFKVELGYSLHWINYEGEKWPLM